MVAKGGSTINCWDAESGTFLGKLSCLGAEMSSNPLDFDIPKNGLPVNETTGRAYSNVMKVEMPAMGTAALEDDTTRVEPNGMGRIIKGAVTVHGFARRLPPHL